MCDILFLAGFQETYFLKVYYFMFSEKLYLKFFYLCLIIKCSFGILENVAVLSRHCDKGLKAITLYIKDKNLQHFI